MHNESQQRDPSFQALPLTLVCFLYYFILQKFDYAIWTGDVPPHNIWNQSRADQVKCLDGCLIVNNLSFHTHSVSFSHSFPQQEKNEYIDLFTDTVAILN